jgi:hypothetical protein
MNYKEFEAERRRLIDEQNDAAKKLEYAKSHCKGIEEDHRNLVMQQADALTDEVTDEVRAKLAGLVAESAEKRTTARDEVETWEARLGKATQDLEAFDTVSNQAIARAESAKEFAAKEREYAKPTIDQLSPIYRAINLQTQFGIPTDVSVDAAADAASFHIAKVSTDAQVLLQQFGPDPRNDGFNNINREVDSHNKQIEQLETFADQYHKKVEGESVDVEREFTIAKAEAKLLLDFQKMERNSLYETNLTPDSQLRTTQLEVRRDLQEKYEAASYCLTCEICRPLAERNVENSPELAAFANKNQKLLDLNATRIADRPDADIQQQEYANLLQGRYDDKKQEGVEREVTGLQQQHFPEITPPSIETAALGRSGPSRDREGPDSPER